MNPEPWIARQRAGRAARIIFAGLLALWLVAPPAGAQSQPGALDPGFQAQDLALNQLKGLAVLTNGVVVAGGALTVTNALDETLNALAGLDTNGAIAAAFSAPAIFSRVSSVAQDAIGRLWCAGQQAGMVNARLVRLLADGTLDPEWTNQVVLASDTAPWVHSLAVQPDGKLILAGSFTSCAGVARTNLARVYAHGSVDLAFAANFQISGEIFCAALQNNGKILIGGAFTRLHGKARNRIARLNSDGSLDPTFDPGVAANQPVCALAVQPDGKIIAAGYFTRFHTNAITGLVRLLPDGKVDSTYNLGSGAAALSGSPFVQSAIFQTDGKLLIGGRFDSFNGVGRTNLARLNFDGVVDPGFEPPAGLATPIAALALRPDGLLMAGATAPNGEGGSATGSLFRLFNDGASPVAPFLTVQPEGGTMLIGSVFSFSVAALGTLPLRYQWYQDGYDLPGKTNAVFTLPGVSWANSGGYYCVVANSGGSATSSVASLQASLVPLAPSFSQSLAPVFAAQGADALLTLTPQGTGPFAWQWRKNGMAISGATNASLNLASLTTNLAGGYTLVAANAAGLATSAPVSVMVYVPLVNRVVGLGESMSWNLALASPGATRLQWRLNGTNILNATNATLTLSNAAPFHAGAYDVVVRNSAGEFQVPAASLTVLTPPTVVLDPPLLAYTAGSNCTLVAHAAGSQPMFLQWRRQGTNLPGATSAQLTLPAATLADAGYYDVVVSNAWGAVTSAVAVVGFPGMRRAWAADAEAFGDDTIILPVSFEALGDENTVGFSLQFEPSLLHLQYVTNHAALPDGTTLLLNLEQVKRGGIGVLAARQAGDVFPAGVHALLELSFKLANGLLNATNTFLAFSSLPIPQQVISPAVQPLSLPLLRNGQVTIQPGWEGDVSPEPQGDHLLSATDWTLAGLYASGLNSASNLPPSAFQRLDCAPVGTLGDGLVNAADWVQVGRYMVGLDEQNVAGGPSNFKPAFLAPSLAPMLMDRQGAGMGARMVSLGSSVSAADGRIRLPVEIQASGEENTFAFTLAFDSRNLCWQAAATGPALGSGALLFVNTNRAGSGSVSILAALAPGSKLPAGVRHILWLDFKPLPASGPRTCVVAFADTPIAREVISHRAAVLPATWQSGAVELAGELRPQLSLRAPSAGQALALNLHVTRPGTWVVETSTNLIDWMVWTNVNAEAGLQSLKDPAFSTTPCRFYRVR